MSKRARSHALEEESRAVFRTLLPQGWVFRDETPDYGVDGSIEIFGANEETTGLRMFVQLKATDSKDPKQQRNLKFRSETKAYWDRQKHPTLLVRYCSVDRTIYWTWHFDRRISSREDQKTISLKFHKSDIWNKNSPHEIHENLIAFARLKDQPTIFPIPLRMLRVESAEEVEIDDILRCAFSTKRSLIAYGDLRPGMGAISISVEQGSICVDFEGLTSATFPGDIRHPEQLAADVIVAVAIGFSKLGKFNVVRPLLSEAYRQSSLIKHAELATSLAQALIQTKDLAFSRSIASHLIETGGPYQCAQVYALMPIMHLNELSDQDIRDHQKHLIDHIHFIRQSYPDSLGIAAYNTGEFLLATGKLRLAFRYFRISAQASSYYAKAPYLWNQASGILFRLKHHTYAAYGYLKVLRLEKTRSAETMALVADALLHRGRIGSAIRWLNKAIESEELARDPRFFIFSLQWIAAQKMAILLGDTRIAIKTRESEVLYTKAHSDGECDAPSILLEAVTLNPGDPKIWSALAYLAGKKGEKSEARDYALIAAALSDGEASYWLDLMLLSMAVTSDLTSLVLVAVSSAMPDLVAEELYYRVRNATDDALKSDLRSLANSLSKLPRSSMPLLIRIIREKASRQEEF